MEELENRLSERSQRLHTKAGISRIGKSTGTESRLEIAKVLGKEEIGNGLLIVRGFLLWEMKIFWK